MRFVTSLSSILALSFLALVAHGQESKKQKKEPPVVGGAEAQPPKIGGAEAQPPEIGGAEAEPPDTLQDDAAAAAAQAAAEAAAAQAAAFPGLDQLTFGQPTGPFSGTTGVLRGGQSLFDTPLAGDIVTRQQIAEKQASDMFQALQNEVGIMMQRTAIGQTSPYVRGLTGQQVLILVDGIRLNNSFFRRGPNQYFNTIDPGMVDHIEVLRGSGSVLWGSDAVGGVINVVTRGADVQYGMCCGDYEVNEFHQIYNTADSTSYSRMNVEGWVGQMGVFGGGSFLNVRDLDTGFDFGRQPGTNYQSYSGDIKFNYLIDRNQLLTLSFQHLEQENVPRSDRFPGFPGDLIAVCPANCS